MPRLEVTHTIAALLMAGIVGSTSIHLANTVETRPHSPALQGAPSHSHWRPGHRQVKS
ncbi:hypothetical protein [Rhizobium sp. P44RR-XXIV]|uniref:hypothetical protein n=1 Tax=Rhizobium sp. P44RR-XXIV TaxID=1921145 RepID=UPI00145B3EEB|nr:hypothetical protein [Rhizobium sp. P44RR-XXIV]